MQYACVSHNFLERKKQLISCKPYFSKDCLQRTTEDCLQDQLWCEASFCEKNINFTCHILIAYLLCFRITYNTLGLQFSNVQHVKILFSKNRCLNTRVYVCKVKTWRPMGFFSTLVDCYSCTVLNDMKRTSGACSKVLCLSRQWWPISNCTPRLCTIVACLPQVCAGATCDNKCASSPSRWSFKYGRRQARLNFFAPLSTVPFPENPLCKL